MARSGWGGTAVSVGMGLATAVLVGGISALGLGAGTAVSGMEVVVLATAVVETAVLGAVGGLVQPTKTQITNRIMNF